MCRNCVGAAARQTPRVRQVGATTPYATYTLIAINVVVYIVAALQAHTSALTALNSRILWNGGLFEPKVADGEYYRLITSGFLHLSVWHIAANMIALLLIGAQLEKFMGTARFTGVYFISMLGGAAAVLALGDVNTLTAGASGAIYGLLGALLVIVVRGGQPPTQIVVIIALNLFITLAVPGISLWDHLGGLVFGTLTMAAIVYLPRLVPDGRSGRAALINRLTWVTLGGLVVVTALLGVAAALGR